MPKPLSSDEEKRETVPEEALDGKDDELSAVKKEVAIQASDDTLESEPPPSES